MTIFYVGCLIIFAGLGFVGWLLYSEKKESSEPNTGGAEGENPSFNPDEASQMLDRLGLSDGEEAAEKPAKKFDLSSLLSKIPFVDKIPILKDKIQPVSEEVQEVRPHLPSDELPEIEPPQPDTGTASIRPISEIPPAEAPVDPTTHETLPEEPEETPPPVEEQTPMFIDEEPAEAQEGWQKKYERLDALFQEKSQELEKLEKSMNNELKHRKEFNKIKDILEKEIKELKVKCRNLQVEMTTAETETSGYKTRISQLEEKSTNLQKQINEYEDSLKERDKEILSLKKQTQQQPQETPSSEAEAPVEPPPTDESPAEPTTDEAVSEETPAPEESAPKEPETQTEIAEESTPEEPESAPEQADPESAADEEPPTLMNEPPTLSEETEQPASPAEETQFYIPENMKEQDDQPQTEESGDDSQPIEYKEFTGIPESSPDDQNEERPQEHRFSPAGEELKPVSNLESTGETSPAEDNGLQADAEKEPMITFGQDESNSDSNDESAEDKESADDQNIVLNVLEKVDAMDDDEKPQESPSSEPPPQAESEEEEDQDTEDIPQLSLPPDIMEKDTEDTTDETNNDSNDEEPSQNDNDNQEENKDQ